MTPSTSLKSILSVWTVANIMIEYPKILLILVWTLIEIQHFYYSLTKLFAILDNNELLSRVDFWMIFESIPKSLLVLVGLPSFAIFLYFSKYPVRNLSQLFAAKYQYRHQLLCSQLCF